jgi:hypothetical protein
VIDCIKKWSINSSNKENNMAATAFVIGFFTAMGWWSANRVIATTVESPPAIIKTTTGETK